MRRQKILISRWEELSLSGGIEARIEAFGERFMDADGGTELGRMSEEFFKKQKGQGEG